MSDTQSPYSEDDADPYAAEDTKNPWEETVGDGEEPAADEEAPDEAPKRRPGRPRKTPEA